MKFIWIILIMISPIAGQDWPALNRYSSDNKLLGLPKADEKRVVFMGNSITESWSVYQPEFFEGKSYINRGISGQTTPQMLIRFRPDVIDLKPQIVVILAGINDIAGNTGPSTEKMIVDNIISMAELAKSNSIDVIICSILPANDFSWSQNQNPSPKILAVNQALKKYSKINGMVYLDYYTSMVNEQEGLIKDYGLDSVHPNKKGYQVMSKLLEKKIIEILN